MEVWSLDKDFNTNKIIDSFESLIWNVRYNDYGDFEVYTYPDPELIDMFNTDMYMWIKEEPYRPMVIESLKIETDAENGNRMTITGRSLESLLDRRCVWYDTILKGNFQNEVIRLLNNNVVSPQDDARRIPNFIVKTSDDTRITEIEVDTKVSAGEKLGETINSLCQEKDIGWKVYLDDDYNFIFELFCGNNYSYEQDENSFVVFSKNFDNLISSDYEVHKNAYTATLIVGERDAYVEEHGTGDENDCVRLVIDPSATGLDRSEVKTDCSGVSSKREDDTQMYYTEYHSILESKGRENVATLNKGEETVEAELDYNGMFHYGDDYEVGDILQLENEYGIVAKVRVTEMIRSQDTSGIAMYPTFTVIKEGGP